jgi:O-6-methylguanine DNA methyltransferase
MARRVCDHTGDAGPALRMMSDFCQPIGVATDIATLRDIPYGETITYGQLADRIGQPSAARAVGLANGKNPIGVIVSCHRVVGSTGNLTGYGDGLATERYLLDFE